MVDGTVNGYCVRGVVNSSNSFSFCQLLSLRKCNHCLFGSKSIRYNSNCIQSVLAPNRSQIHFACVYIVCKSSNFCHFHLIRSHSWFKIFIDVYFLLLMPFMCAIFSLILSFTFLHYYYLLVFFPWCFQYVLLLFILSFSLFLPLSLSFSLSNSFSFSLSALSLDVFYSCSTSFDC